MDQIDPTRTPHHWLQGPQDVTPVRPFTARDSAGTPLRFAYRFRWLLERVEGTTRREAVRAIYAVLRHPRSWERAGVRFVRTFAREDAHILVRVIPADRTVCGPGSAGCYSWGYEPDGKPVAEIGVEYLPWSESLAVILGMELCAHGAFRAADMYSPAHQPYEGVLGDWAAAARAGYYPTDAEIADAREWLAGRAPFIHDEAGAPRGPGVHGLPPPAATLEGSA